MSKIILNVITILLINYCLAASTLAHEQQLYLSRFVPNLKYGDADLTRDTETATYKPIFGEGDANAELLNGIVRVGELTVQPGGASTIVTRPGEEYVLFVTEGKGILIYDQ